MKPFRLTIVRIGFILLIAVPASAGMIDTQTIERLNTDDMHVLDSSVTLVRDLELLVFSKTSFKFNVVSAYMQVNTSKAGPMLGVYRVYQVQSGDLRLPYQVHPQ